MLIGGALLAGMLHSHTSIWLLVAVSALLGLPNGFNNRQPPSTVAAQCAALTRTLRAESGHGSSGRLLIPVHSVIDSTGARHRRYMIKPGVLAGAQQVGFEVLQADLVDLGLDAAGRLLASDVPVDIVLLGWRGSDRIVDDGGGLAALRTADRARTVELFPRPEQGLVSSKAVLSWRPRGL